MFGDSFGSSSGCGKSSNDVTFSVTHLAQQWIDVDAYKVVLYSIVQPDCSATDTPNKMNELCITE